MKPPLEASKDESQSPEGRRERAIEEARVAAVNADRVSRRGFIVFATDPEVQPDHPSYRSVFATEAETRARAVAKVRPLAGERRLRAFRITKRYGDELAEARWID